MSPVASVFTTAILSTIIIVPVFLGLWYLFKYFCSDVVGPIVRECAPEPKNTVVQDRYSKQQEVWDSFQQIKFQKVNLRGTTLKQMMEEHPEYLPEEAMLWMIFEDCQDMGIQMNIPYADRLTNASYAREQHDKIQEKYKDRSTYKTQPLPGRTPLTREQVAAKYAAERNANKQ